MRKIKIIHLSTVSDMLFKLQNLCIYILFCLSDTLALRDVSVTIPQAVVAGDTVALYCRYNLEDEPLYTVKWYKGQSEFYRYLPKELPNTQVFPLPGINVDVSSDPQIL